jgi:hypothetical protein
MWRTRPKRPGASKALVQVGIGLLVVVAIAILISVAR